MTPGAEGDEVLLGIVAQSPPRVDVVHLEIGCASTVLAAPAVALQDLLVQSAIGLGVEPEAWTVQTQASHEAFLSCSKNCRRCGGGRN
jgi:hypothetical protein